MLKGIMQEMFGVDIIQETKDALNQLIATACENAGFPEVKDIPFYEEQQEYMEERGFELDVNSHKKPGCFTITVIDIESEKIVAMSRLETEFTFKEDGIEISLEGMSLNEKGLSDLNNEFEEFKAAIGK